MADLTTSLILSLRNSQFVSGLRQSGRGVEQFSHRSQRELRTLKRDFQALTGNVLGNFRSELLAIGTGWAGLKIAKDAAQLDKGLTRITQTAGVARQKSGELRRELFALQRQYGVLVEDSRKGNDTLLQGGLNWAQALGGSRAIAPASAVTGARPEVLAGALGVGSEIFGFDLAQAGVATDILDKMTVAGRLGNAELEDLAGIFSRVGGNASKANLSFDQTLGFIEQLSLIERQPERLATLADSTLRIFTNQKYLKNVQGGLGVKFYDGAGARRDSFDVIGDIAAIYRKQKTDVQRDALIAYAFGDTDLDTQKGIQALLSGNSVAGMRDKAQATRQAGGTIAAGLDDALDNAIDQTARLKAALGESADYFGQRLNDGVEWSVKKLLDSKDKGGLGLDGNDLLLGGGAALLAGGAAYRYGGPTVRKLLGKAGGLAGGVATGKALEAAAGVTPVYVVNMPSAFGTGSGSVVDDLVDAAGGKRRSGRAGRGRMPRLPGSGRLGLPGPGGLTVPAGPAINLPGWGAVLKGWLAPAAMAAGRVSLPGAAGAAGYGAGTLLYNQALSGTAAADAIGAAVARALAAFGNAEAQAALNSTNKMRGEMKVVVSDDRVRVDQVRSANMDIDVSGLSMGGY